MLVLHDGGFPPTLLHSTDRRTWDERALPSLEGRAFATVIAASESAYVLPVDGSCLWSTDGRNWQETPANADNGWLRFNEALSDGGTFVAWRPYPASHGIWASRDGRSWTMVSLPGAPAVLIDAVAARPGGGYVVAGRVGPTASELDAIEGPATLFQARPGRQALWTSDDGVLWAPVLMGPGFETARFTSVAAGGPGEGVVAVGPATSQDELDGVEPELGVWRWTDATGWVRLRSQGFPVVERDPGQTRILATGSRWLLVGARMRPGATSVLDTTSTGVLAGSEDGSAWWAVGTVLVAAGSEEYYVDGIAVEPRRLLFTINWYGPGLSDEHVEIWASRAVDGG
jgi:hypothetical protein